MEKWYDYLTSISAAKSILDELGVEEASELSLLDADDVAKVASVLPKVKNVVQPVIKHSDSFSQ